MAKGRRSSRATDGRPTVTLTVPLPPDLDLPRKIPWQQPRQRSLWDKAIRVPLRRTIRRAVPRSVTVVMPRNVPRELIRPSVVQVSHRGISIAPRRRAKRLLSYEPNRKRVEERKFRRARRYLFGQLDSLEHDTFGLIGNAFRANMDIGSIAERALITRAIHGQLGSHRTRRSGRRVHSRKPRRSFRRR